MCYNTRIMSEFYEDRPTPIAFSRRAFVGMTATFLGLGLFTGDASPARPDTQAERDHAATAMALGEYSCTATVKDLHQQLEGDPDVRDRIAVQLHLKTNPDVLPYLTRYLGASSGHGKIALESPHVL